MADSRIDKPETDQPEGNPKPQPRKPRVRKISRLSGGPDEDIETDANGMPVLVEPKLPRREHPRRPMTLSPDTEYSKTIVDDWVRPAPQGDTANPPAPPAAAATPEPVAGPAPQSASDAEEPVPTAPAISSAEGPDSDADDDWVLVSPHVRPLRRHERDLAELGAAGLRIPMILRLARQGAQKRFRASPVYSEDDPADRSRQYRERMFVKVRRTDLSALSEQAGDLGTWPPARLIRAQVDAVWTDELDTVIGKLKERGQKSAM